MDLAPAAPDVPPDSAAWPLDGVLVGVAEELPLPDGFAVVPKVLPDPVEVLLLADGVLVEVAEELPLPDGFAVVPKVLPDPVEVLLLADGVLVGVGEELPPVFPLLADTFPLAEEVLSVRTDFPLPDPEVLDGFD